MKILLIEDDLDIAASLADYLEYQEMTVDFAYSVNEAKNLLAKDTFDLLIMDVNLPDGNGISLCRELKQKNKIKQPVLFLTAKGELKDKLNAFDSGAVDYMVKPFSMRELCARIKALNAHINTQEGYETCKGVLSVCHQTGTVTFNSLKMQLHSTGIKIISALIDSYPKPISTERLCSIVWNDNTPKSNPLKSHISRINRQFIEAAQEKIVCSIRGIGYKLTIEDQSD